MRVLESGLVLLLKIGRYLTLGSGQFIYNNNLLILEFTVLFAVSAFASAMMLGPRLGRYTYGIKPLPLGTPVNCAMGLFVLWWGWLAFNSGRYKYKFMYISGV